MKSIKTAASFRATVSLPGYNSIAVELSEEALLDEGENAKTARAALLAQLKVEVSEALIAAKKGPK